MRPHLGNVTSTLSALAAEYLQPWRSGITLAAVDDAHVRWADYRDAEWGGFVPIGENHNRLLRVNVLNGQLYYVSCAGSKSVRRLMRQRAVLRLLQAVLDMHSLPDLDLVLSISDRPTVPRRAVRADLTPPPVFAYARTPRHFSVPFPPVSFDPARWPKLHSSMTVHPPLTARAASALCKLAQPQNWHSAGLLPA